MIPLLRASAIAALTLACVDGHAEAHRSCIRSLGAQPAAETPPRPTLSSKKSCLTALAFVAQTDPRAVRRPTVIRA